MKKLLADVQKVNLLLMNMALGKSSKQSKQTLGAISECGR